MNLLAQWVLVVLVGLMILFLLGLAALEVQLSL
jgi:hypothetical protein